MKQLLWIPVGLVCLLLIVLIEVLDWFLHLGALVQDGAQWCEDRLCDFMRRYDPATDRHPANRFHRSDKPKILP